MQKKKNKTNKENALAHNESIYTKLTFNFSPFLKIMIYMLYSLKSFPLFISNGIFPPYNPNTIDKKNINVHIQRSILSTNSPIYVTINYFFNLLFFFSSSINFNIYILESCIEIVQQTHQYNILVK